MKLRWRKASSTRCEASLELLIRKLKGENTSPFRLECFRTFMDVHPGDVIVPPRPPSGWSIRMVPWNITAADGTVR